jgi:hypothetical protein
MRGPSDSCSLKGREASKPSYEQMGDLPLSSTLPIKRNMEAYRYVIRDMPLVQSEPHKSTSPKALP